MILNVHNGYYTSGSHSVHSVLICVLFCLFLFVWESSTILWLNTPTCDVPDLVGFWFNFLPLNVATVCPDMNKILCISLWLFHSLTILWCWHSGTLRLCRSYGGPSHPLGSIKRTVSPETKRPLSLLDSWHSKQGNNGLKQMLRLCDIP